MLNHQHDKSNQSLINNLFGIEFTSKESRMDNDNNDHKQPDLFQQYVSDIIQQWQYDLSCYSNAFIDQFNQVKGNTVNPQQFTMPNQFDFKFDIDQYVNVLLNAQKQNACNTVTNNDQGLNDVEKAEQVDNCFQSQLTQINDQMDEEKVKQSSQSSRFLSLASKDTIATIPSSPKKSSRFDKKKNFRLFKTMRLSIRNPPHKVVYLRIKRNLFNKKPQTPFVSPLFKLSKSEANTMPIITSQPINSSNIKMNESEVKEFTIKEITKQIAKRKQKTPRGSRYRGVSKNGNQWQVLIMVNKTKRYVGSYSNEEEAARAYDKVALQNHGVKARTNFDYIEEDVERILSEPPLLKLSIG